MLLNKQNLLPTIAKYIPKDPVIIEAGSFTGADTNRLAKFWPRGTIHCFEPVPEIFKRLEHNTHNLKKVHPHNIALSSQTGTAQFHVSELPTHPGKPFQAGSLLAPKERLNWSPAQYPKKITVPTITLDDWAKQNKINHVDFMWLDLQGHELAVIQAASQLLKMVRVIYMEVQFINAYENQPKYPKVKQWMLQNNFIEVGADFADQTGWFFGNALFVKSFLTETTLDFLI